MMNNPQKTRTPESTAQSAANFLQIVLVLEDKTGQPVSRDDYCGILRESFQFNHFIQTRLYDNLLSWQKTSGFDILKTESGTAN
jgi:hypothetical protein